MRKISLRKPGGYWRFSFTNSPASTDPIANLPFCVVPGIPAVAARSKRLTYRDYGYAWEISDKNGFYSTFAYQR